MQPFLGFRKLVAEAFDYIKYPMLLTQPKPTGELVRDAIEEFLSRNEIAEH